MYANNRRESLRPIEKGYHLYVRTCSASWCGWNNTVLKFSRERELIGGILYEEMYYEELTHSIMEAEKSHNLPTITSSPGKLGVQVSPGAKTWEPGVAAGHIPAQKMSRKGQILLSFALLSCSGPQWVGWRPTSIEEGTLLSWIHHGKC